MKRHTFALRIHKDAFSAYRQKLGILWPALTDFLDRNHIKNFSLWNIEDLVFGYCELPDDHAPSEAECAAKEALICEIQDTFSWISDPKQGMRLMYHDFGIVRPSKELIRHRVFMTKLKDGCEEEYKRRHDALVAARGDSVTTGPDSNFSIWSAGGYIFGYDEIDITMEHLPNEAEHQSTIDWETRQLEIMDWITNDMDWLTGQVHPNIHCIARHLS